MKQIMRISFLAAAMLWLSVSTFSQDRAIKKIAFPKGKNTIVLKGKTSDNCCGYQIKIRRGQRLIVKLTSVKSNAFFAFDTKKTFDDGGDFLCEECRTLNKIIAESGDWMIGVFHANYPTDKGAADFTLTITLK